jgi:molybdopterin-biosynthesis enzyme MoeA-like protein
MPQGSEGLHQPFSVVIAVGDELLRGHTQDTNTYWLAQRLYALGYPARRIHTIADSGEEIVRWVQAELAEQPACLFVCGGLGPTPDDRTLEALGVALERPLRVDETAQRHIQVRIDWLHGIGRIPSREMSEANRRMATIPTGATVLPNSIGMAPGLAIALSEPGSPDRHLFVLPGVPRELKTIFDEEISPRYLGDGRPHAVEEVHFHMAVEAEFWLLLRKIEMEFSDVSVGSYPQPDRGHLIIRLAGHDAARVHAAAETVKAEAPARIREPRPAVSEEG